MMKHKFTWRWFEIGLITLTFFVHIYIATRPAASLMNWYSNDDGFYYFKVAQNITNGLGVTFDGINPTNGFHPLWMLVCIPVFALARFNLILPLRLLVLVVALLNAGTAILIFRLLRKFISPVTAAAMGILWVFLPSIHEIVAQSGLESTISAFFLMLLLYLVIQWREKRLGFWKLVPIGIVAGLATLARLDNIFVVMLLGVWFVFGLTSNYLSTLVVGDLALIFISGLLSYYFRLTAGPNYIANSDSLPWLVALGFITIPISLFLFGLYSPVGEKLSWKFVVRGVLAVTLASGLTGACLLAFQKAGLFQALPRSVILLNFAGDLFCVIGLRLLAGVVFRNETIPEKISLRSRGFWKTILPRALGMFLPMGFLVGIYMMWSYLYFGTPMPISGEVKHWWGSLPNTVYGSPRHTLSELLGITGISNAWHLAFSPMQFFSTFTAMLVKIGSVLTVGSILEAVLILLIVAVLFLQRKWVIATATEMSLFALFLGLYAQIFSFTSTSYVHIRNWYWVGEMLFTVICFGILLECTYLTLKRFRIKPFVWEAAMALLCVGVLILFSRMALQRFHSVSLDLQEHFQDGIHSLEVYTEPGALIGTTGGGSMGYFIEGRTIVNLDGLINSPEYFHMLQIGQGAVFLDRMGLDYVVGSDYMLNNSDPYQQLLKGHLKKITQTGTMTLFRYIPSPKLEK